MEVSSAPTSDDPPGSVRYPLSLSYVDSEAQVRPLGHNQQEIHQMSESLRKMTFLKKLLNLSGCTKLKPAVEDNELIDKTDEESHVLIGGMKTNKQNYVPWQSPTISSRRMLTRVRDSPRLARKMMSKMTSPDPGKKEREKTEIFIVNIEVIHESGTQIQPNGTVDGW